MLSLALVCVRDAAGWGKAGAQRRNLSRIPAWNRETYENLPKSPFSRRVTILPQQLLHGNGQGLLPAEQFVLTSSSVLRGIQGQGDGSIPNLGIRADTGMEQPLSTSAAQLSSPFLQKQESLSVLSRVLPFT